MSFQSGYIQPLWDDSVQNQINALSNVVSSNFEFEAHVIACQIFFRIDKEVIIEAMRNCLKPATENINKDQFTICLFNRLTLKRLIL